jgi:hypothetical protein
MIKYPGVNTCITITFCFQNMLVGIHLGMQMGVSDYNIKAQQEGNWIDNGTIQSYMHRARQIMKETKKKGLCTKVYLIGAMDFWHKDPRLKNQLDYISSGVNRWASELNSVVESHQFNDEEESIDGSQTVNIYVSNPGPKYEMRALKGGQEGAIVSRRSSIFCDWPPLV